MITDIAAHYSTLIFSSAVCFMSLMAFVRPASSADQINTNSALIRCVPSSCLRFLTLAEQATNKKIMQTGHYLLLGAGGASPDLSLLEVSLKSLHGENYSIIINLSKETYIFCPDWASLPGTEKDSQTGIDGDAWLFGM